MPFDPALAAPDAARQRFDALILERTGTPFAWGRHDCCLWAADCVLAITGTDPAADVRGTYADAAGAAAVLAGIGGIETAGARAGEQIAPMFATWGDVGLVVSDGRNTLAVCAGAGWLAPAADGLALLPFNAAMTAWRVARG